jgi:hypothetical protein
MKLFSLTIFFLLLMSSPYLVAGESPKSNESVKFEISVKPKSMKAGSSGELLISLKPKEGIHITLEPPMTLKLDSTDAVTAVGKLIFSKAAKVEYLDASKSIKQYFTLSKKIKPGPLHLKGAFTYFYCSGTDGFCARFKQPVNVVVTIVK